MAVRRIVGRGVVDMFFFPNITDCRDGCVSLYEGSGCACLA